MDANLTPKKVFVLEYLSDADPLKIIKDKSDSYIIFTKKGITKISAAGKKIW
jgi:hypothetical protein